MGLIDWMFSLPLWLMAAIITGFLGGFALLALRVARRHVLPRLGLTYDDAYYAAAMVQSAMLLYGLIAALTAVGVWQRYSAVSDVVSNEATAIASLYRDLGGYPQPVRDATRDILRDYTKQIINEAWPQQRLGVVPREGVAWMDRLQEKLFAFEPATESHKAIHAETLRAFNNLVQQRRQRLDAVRGGLPDVFWIVLLPGAMLCIVLCLFFHVPSPRYQAVLLLGVTVVLAMLLFLIVALDRPYWGVTGISPDSYQLIYDHYMIK